MEDLSETHELTSLKGQRERENLLAYLFLKHRERLKNMVRLRLDPRLRGRIDPSDVVQESYLEASGRLEELVREPDVPLYIWLRFITAQKLQALHRHHLGAKQRDARREISIFQGPIPHATSEALAIQLLAKGASPSEAAIQREMLLRLEEALDAMDPIDREMIALRHFESLTSGEAARVLGIKERAASKRYLRALERLKEILKPQAED